jgi:hypothetical protein
MTSPQNAEEKPFSFFLTGSLSLNFRTYEAFRTEKGDISTERGEVEAGVSQAQ